MGTRSGAVLGAARRAAAIRADLGRDLARLREDAGVTRAAVGRAARVSGSTVGRIESAVLEPDLATLIRIASTLGADVSIRLFPSGLPIRDRFQAPMLEAVLATAHPTWRKHIEVPVHGTTRSVIDCVLCHPTLPLLLALEAQSELRRADAVIRRSTDTTDALIDSSIARSAAARRGAPVVTSSLLVLRSTSANRAIVADLSRTFAAAFPARAVDALAALRDPGAPWPGPAIVWVHLHGRTASVMDTPPRGISVGR